MISHERLFEDYNWRLFFVTLALVAIGLINLYSSLYLWGDVNSTKLFWQQVLWVAVGLLIMFGLSFFDYRIYDHVAIVLHIIVMIMLVLVLVVGKSVGGNKSWLGVGGFGIQPAEFAKLTTIVMLSRYFTRHPHPDGYTFFDLIIPGMFALVPMILVVLGKDVGSSLFFLLLFLSMAWFVRIKWRALAFILIAVIAVGAVGYTKVLSDSQKSRFITFLNPEQDLRGAGYHLAQSKIAVGSGGFFGKGYLKGSINKLKYLPEKHTDFVFPVLAEEWGFFGSCVVLTLYLALLLLGVDIAKKSRDRFGIFLATGLVALVFWQTFINLCGVLGLMPLTGVTLPFLSYGGSSIISVLAGMGILLNVSRKSHLF